MNDYLEIGQIVNTHGVKGFLKIVPFTDDIYRFNDLKKIYIVQKGNLVKFLIEEVKYNKNVVLLKLKGINDINEAEKYKNCFLKIDREDAVELPKDSYFIADLIGVNVYTNSGELLGVMEDVFQTGSNDVYVVKNELGKQILLPAIKSVIQCVDVQNNKIIVNLIEGLI